jgi:hypothetical protein
MARKASRPDPTAEQTLRPVLEACPHCGGPLRFDYDNWRTVSTLGPVLRLRLKVARCHGRTCTRFHKPYRPEAEGRLALPQHEFGLDVIALVGALRYRQHRSVPEVHRELASRGLVVCERTVTNLLDRYDELVAARMGDGERLRGLLAKQGRVVLAIDGLQPDVGHEVLWVLRDCLSGEVLLARSLLSSTEADLAALIEEVKAGLDRGPGEGPVPVAAAVSDGQHSVRNAVARALPGVPHQLCHFHYLREAARPLYEMDRHAKKELKKQVRDVRPIERAVEARAAAGDAQAAAVLGYCSAVRSAVTDDGRPPLEASGLKLHERLAAVAASLASVEQKGACPRN